jgi:hypothetical protein
VLAILAFSSKVSFITDLAEQFGFKPDLFNAVILQVPDGNWQSPACQDGCIRHNAQAVISDRTDRPQFFLWRNAGIIFRPAGIDVDP